MVHQKKYNGHIPIDKLYAWWIHRVYEAMSAKVA